MTITSNYAGESSSSHLVGKAIAKMDVIQHARFIPDVKFKENIGKIDLSNVLQAYTENPTTFGSATVSDAVIEPREIMALFDYNPRKFEKYWRQYQPEGPLDFRTLKPEVQEAMTRELIALVAESAAMTLIQGDTEGTEFPAFDGIIKKALASPATLDVASAVALTNLNVKDKLIATVKRAPLAVRRQKDFKVFVSPATMALYEEAQHNQTNKGKDFTEAGAKTILGFPIYDLIGMPDDHIFAGNFGTGEDSNLVIGQDGSMDSVLVDRKNNYSDLYFFKLTTKLGINCVRFEETALYSYVAGGEA